MGTFLPAVVIIYSHPHFNILRVRFRCVYILFLYLVFIVPQPFVLPH